jgi:hypothetical protein
MFLQSNLVLSRRLRGLKTVTDKKVDVSNKVKAMPCMICVRLEQAAAAVVRSDPPNVLLGLNEAGLRNRARRKEERTFKAETDLETHERSCANKE